MFAVTGALLERSTAYQRLANAIQPVPPTRNDGAAAPCFETATEAEGSDPFGVREPHRLQLRLIGALWSYGALIISGLYRGKERLTPNEVIWLNAKRVGEALRFMRRRMDREIDYAKVETLCDQVTDHVLDKVGFRKLSPDFVPIRNKACEGNSELIPTAAAVLALDALNRKHAAWLPDTGEDNQKIDQLNDFLKRGKADLQPYCLIIWASAYLQCHWTVLRNCDRPISLPASAPEDSPDDVRWWRAATRLHIIADEAGKGIGFSLKRSEAGQTPREETQSKPLTRLQAGSDCRTILEHYQAAFDEVLLKKLGTNERGLRFGRTLTRCFEDELGSVLPKARTPGPGCTLRSMSHNFALLPPKGRVRARWARQSQPDHKTVYNILIVPYPYQIKSRYVRPASSDEHCDDWDFFEIAPEWIYDRDGEQPKDDPSFLQDCQERFWLFLKGLLDDQAEDTVHAVVLPEAALDWETFDVVQAKIAAFYPAVTMLVCGLTSAMRPGDEKPTPGNYVATYMRSGAMSERGADGTIANSPWRILHFRSKHHRWRIDVGQLRTYALSHRLSPEKLWWERIDLPPREMFFAEFTSGSIVTTLICEDLARIEPCQVALRSVGPNLVLVLLMDNAQIFKRWPYQYAGVLADDPGSSVLTLTSFGLIKRSNLSENRTSREIALWREPHGGGAIEINLPTGYHAQLISIRRDYCFERTLDGRGDNHDSAAVWKFAGLIPIRSNAEPPGGGP